MKFQKIYDFLGPTHLSVIFVTPTEKQQIQKIYILKNTNKTTMCLWCSVEGAKTIMKLNSHNRENSTIEPESLNDSEGYKPSYTTSNLYPIIESKDSYFNTENKDSQITYKDTEQIQIGTISYQEKPISYTTSK
jgi:hypothetical protein